MNKLIRILFALFLITALVLPRLVDLASFTAADEPFWLVVGANYYYALTHFEFENTVYEYHPAVTTMWIVTAAMLIYFPEYRGLMNGYFQQEKTSFDTYLVEQGKDPLGLLWWSRLIQTLLNLLLWFLAFLLLKRILSDAWAASAVILFASFAPYLFGQSRMLNHESMLALFSLNAILALVVYLFHGRKLGYLVLSALVAALANLTKSSAIVLVPVVALMIFIFFFLDWRKQKNNLTSISSSVGTFFAWLGITVAFYFLIWPGMWVAPGKMLHEVYGNAFSYAFLGSRLSVSSGLEPAAINLATAFQSFLGILISIAWRTSPLTWFGIAFAIASLCLGAKLELLPLIKGPVVFLLIAAVGSISMFAVISGRDQPHYVMLAYVCVETMAGMGWLVAFRWLGIRFAKLKNSLAQRSMVGVLMAVQIAGLIGFQPYFYTYYNPILRKANAGWFPRFFYGERMETAAAYLAAKPESQYSTALVYFGRSFSYYYPGDTLVFKPVFFDDRQQLQGVLRNSDYLVMYSGLQERLPLLKEMTPEYVIDLNDRPYVEIYRVSDVPKEFFAD